MKNKKKKIIVSTCLIVLLILAVIGVSYAAFSYIRTGEKVNQITTGTISMNYQESSNIIRITGALPTTDETGMKRLTDGEYFDFSVSTNLNGEAVINWEIAAEDFEDNTFDGSNVKFYLTKLEGDVETPVSETLPRVYSEETEVNEKTGRPSNMMSLLVGSTQTQGEETTNYRLRLYIDENYNPQGDGGGLIFKTRINVYGKVDVDEVPEKVQLPVMKRIGKSYEGDFHTYEYQQRITEMEIKTDTIVPETALVVTGGKGNYWDMSESQDDSVIAYVEENGTTTTVTEYVKNPDTGLFTGVKVEAPGYKLTIGGNGGVAANEISSYAFKSLFNAKVVDIKKLDTSNVTNMSYMFTGLGMETIDLSKLSTLKATDMSYMFYGCNNIKSLDLSYFNTSNITNMAYMFYQCNKLEGVKFTNFDTKKVINMNNMFYKCSSLVDLDLSSFDTAEVTRMDFMFYECSSLTNLNINSFDTSKVTSMNDMFYKCSSLTSLDVSNFITSSVTGMNEMFRGCSNLTSLNLTTFDTSKVRDMRYMFVNCSGLTSIIVNQNLWDTNTAYRYNIGSSSNGTTGMFDGCGVSSVTRV